MARAELLGRYEALPLPDTTQEAWRFTDLRGFDPDAFAVPNGAAAATAAVSAEELLEIDVSGLAIVGEGGIEIRAAPEGIEFAPLDESHALLGTLVAGDDKFTAHNAASWQ